MGGVQLDSNRHITLRNYRLWSCRGHGLGYVKMTNCADSYTVEGVSSQIFTGVRVPGSKGWPERSTMPIGDARLKIGAAARLKIGAAADVQPCRDIVNNITIEDNTFVNPRGLVWYAMKGDRLTFQNNRIVFDGRQPYRLQPDVGGTRYDAATRIVEFGNVTTGQ